MDTGATGYASQRNLSRRGLHHAHFAPWQFFPLSRHRAIVILMGVRGFPDMVEIVDTSGSIRPEHAAVAPDVGMSERQHGLRALAFVLILALALPLAGCSRNRPSQPGDVIAQAEVALYISNHHWLDITIYVLHDGQQSRIGTAGATSNVTFILPARMIGQGRQINLIGDPIGSPTLVRTETLLIQPGQSIEWTLESGLERSSVAVY